MPTLRFSVALTALIVSIIGSAETFLIPLIPIPEVRMFCAGSAPALVVFLYAEQASSTPQTQTQTAPVKSGSFTAPAGSQ